MGNRLTVDRFREAVLQGDHRKAEELFYNKKQLRDHVDPRDPCFKGGSSILHYTARHAMMPLYLHFIENEGTDPLVEDDKGQNCLHLICCNDIDPDLRFDMLSSTLRNDFVSRDISRSISIADHDGNTALHFACQFGLQKCIQLLVESGADPSVTNSNKQTPVDLAFEAKHEEIAKKLETRIVFAPVQEEEEGLVIDMDPVPVVPPQDHIAMKNQELQSMKDRLLIETTELLGVSLFVAEALLRNYEWSKERLLDAWMVDARNVCEKAGVDLPEVLTLDNIDDTLVGRGGGAVGGANGATVGIDCSICYDTIDDLVELQCEHHFCKDCWQQYLHDKIKSGQVHNISCPEFGCYKLVPIHIIEKLVSREMASKYLLFDIKAFVDSNPTIRWCPHPGCGEAIKKPTPFTEGLPEEPEDDKSAGMMVHCGSDHYFCWDCGKVAHEPCTCEEWKNWLQKIDNMQIKIGSMTSDDFGEAATSQWITSNSKPCPNCNTAIEKIDGCNHMKCSKCRHDFCWMCLDVWSKHNSSTGGYYDCNRLKVIAKVTEMLEDRREKSDEFGRVAHFQHYHNRYTNHCHSLKLEVGYLQRAGEKMDALKLTAMSEGSSVGDVSFVEDAVRTLVEARHALAASYGYGYSILIVPVRERFEKQQGIFEELVESLAEAVAKPHLRKPRSEIIRLTRTVHSKRLSFISFVQKDLMKSPPMPPMIRESTSEYMTRRREDVEGARRLRARLERERARREREEREEEERREVEERRQLEEALKISQQDYVKQRNEEKLMQKALQASRQEFDEENQLKSDTEFAIMLSMRNRDSNSTGGFSNEDGTNDLSLGGGGGGGDRFPYYSPSQNSQPTDPFNINNLGVDLDHWRNSLLNSNHWAPSSPSSSSSSEAPPVPSPPLREQPVDLLPHRTIPTLPTRNYFNEEEVDEDLATALALSLSTVENESRRTLVTDGGGQS